MISSSSVSGGGESAVREGDRARLRVRERGGDSVARGRSNPGIGPSPSKRVLPGGSVTPFTL